MYNGGDYARHHVSWLSPDVFTDDRLGEFWRKVKNGGEPVEVGFELGLSGELIGYSQRVISVNKVEAYAKSLTRKSYLRYMVMGAGDVVKAAMKGDTNEIEILLTTMANMNSGVSVSMRSATEIAESLNRRINKGDISVPFGIDSLDWATAGTERGTFTVLAGRTSMGKSSLAFQWAEHQALKLGLKVAFFALEMSGEQMFARRNCYKVKNLDGNPASWQDVRAELIDDEQKALLNEHNLEYARKIQGKLFINDDTSTTTADILRTQMKEKFDVIYIDHIGLLKDMKARGERHDQLLGRVTMSLHELAKNTESVVFGLAQLNRKTEDRASNRPTMSDLRDSGKIEENADNIILLFRESYYDPDKQKDIDPMELILGKYRDGSRSSNCYVGFDMRGQKFSSMYDYDLEKAGEEKTKQAQQGTLGDGPEDIPF